jgi:hypothetical protein
LLLLDKITCRSKTPDKPYQGAVEQGRLLMNPATGGSWAGGGAGELVAPPQYTAAPWQADPHCTAEGEPKQPQPIRWVANTLMSVRMLSNSDSVVTRL